MALLPVGRCIVSVHPYVERPIPNRQADNNLNIVVPMLVQTITFGWIFENLLGSSSAAILLAGILLAAVRP